VLNDDGSSSSAIDGTDTGIDGVTVKLYRDSDGNTANGYEQLVGTKTTASGGAFEFTNLGSGNYQIQQTNKAGYNDVTDSDGDTTNPAVNQINVTLVKGSIDSAGSKFLDLFVATPDLLPTAVNDVKAAIEAGTAVIDNVLIHSVSGADNLGDQPTTVTAVVENGASNNNVTLGSAFTTENGGQLTINANGSYSYTPPAQGSVPVGGLVETFTYTITDTDGDTSSATLTINVADNDLSPAAVNDVKTATEAGTAVIDNVLSHSVSGVDNLGDQPTTVTAVVENGASSNNVTLGSAFTTENGGQLTINADGSYSYTPPAQGSVPVGGLVETFTYTITDTDGDPSSATLAINVAGNNIDLITVKTLSSGDSTPDEGDTVTFQITVMNNSATQATNVSLIDSLPAGLTYKAHNTSGGSYSSATGVWTISTLTSGSSATLSLSGTVDVGQGGNTITNITTAASGDQSDPTVSGDDLNESVTVDNNADLVTVKTLQSSDATPNEGDSVTFRITVTNNGAAQATTVSLTDSLPSGLTYTGDTPSQGSYVSGTGVWTIGTLNSGDSVTLDLTGTVDVGEGGNTITNTTTVAAGDQPDPGTTGDGLNESVVVEVPEEPTPPTLDATPPPLAPPVSEDYSPDSTEPVSDAQASSGNLDLSPVFDNLTAINPVSMSGQLEDQFVTEGVLTYSVGDGEFRHDDPSQTLTFTATLTDGSPLPDYIAFDSKTGTFSFDGDIARAEGVESELIRVVATDKLGNRVTSSLQVKFSDAGSEAPAPDPDDGLLVADVPTQKIHPTESFDQKPSSQSTSQNSETSSLGLAEMSPIQLTGELQSLHISEGIVEFVIPQNAFTHTDPTERLSYSITLVDGSPLPDFAEFDPETKKFRFNAEAAQQAKIDHLEIKVVVSDSKNNTLVVVFEVQFGEDEADKAPTERPLDSEVKENQSSKSQNDQDQIHAGAVTGTIIESDAMLTVKDGLVESINNKPNLSEQLQSVGGFGYQQQSNELYENLQALFKNS
jgi:uncharacterized repeat protein (TIGR01451 family)